MNRIILERSRGMWIHAGLLKQFCTDAVNTVVYLIQRAIGAPELWDSGEAWTGKEVNLNH